MMTQHPSNRMQATQMTTNSSDKRTVDGEVAGVEPGCEGIRDHPDKRRRRAAERVESVIVHMRQNLCRPLRVSTLSAIAGFSSSHFTAQFKALKGRAPIDFFIRLRMRHARELLRNGNLKIKETAYLLGYDDPYHFSRIFKSVVGLAPRDYRDMMLDPARKKPGPARTNSRRAAALPKFGASETSERRKPRRTSRLAVA